MVKQKVVDANFVCKHCHKSFTNENRYIKHKCKTMIKLEQFKSPIGQTAYNYYGMWMKGQNKSIPKAESFMSSKNFNTFINFATFAKNVGLVKVDTFIKLMISRQYPPFMWMSDNVYSLYINYLQYNTTPMEHFKLSLQTLVKISDANDIDISDVFSLLLPGDIIRLIRIRKLSPWLLLFSKKFKQMLVDHATPEQQQIINELIQPDVWVDLINKNIEIKDKIKKYLTDIDL